jgi:transcriptional regulator with XRE-family HTH domain
MMMHRIAFIKEKRLVLGMTKRFSRKVLRTQSYISQIESGKKEGLTISVLAKIMKELNSDISFVEFSHKRSDLTPLATF